MLACSVALSALVFVFQSPSGQEPKPPVTSKPPAAAPPPKTPPAGAGAPHVGTVQVGTAQTSTVQFDSSGWPIVADDRPASPPSPSPAPVPAPTAETSRSPAAEGAPASKPNVEPPPTASPALGSGMQLGSPLLDVFQHTHAPAAFKELGGVVIWWRLSTFGAQGEVIGVREVTHTADCAFAERDRLEYGDGRVYGRSGASVFAERGGMPWPTLNDQAQQELALFGIHLRLPWCFGDGAMFVVVGRDTVTRSGDALTRITLERRPAAGTEITGPELDPSPRDRFELLHEPSTGVLREFVHRFANSRQTRRLLLEDWRDVGGVRMPHRRVYIDESLRQTTTLEILRLEPQRTSERDFRLR